MSNGKEGVRSITQSQISPDILPTKDATRPSHAHLLTANECSLHEYSLTSSERSQMPIRVQSDSP